MKIMVCLISEQHVPNLLTIHSINPNHIVLIVTHRMKKNGVDANFMNALRIGGLDYSSEDVTAPLSHKKFWLDKENSIHETKELLKTIFAAYKNAEWHVNITGGTKPMSIGAYEFFKDKNVDMIYVPIVSQSKAIRISDESSLYLNHPVTIREFLSGYGFDFIKNEKEIQKGEARAKELFALSAYLSANFKLAHKMMEDLDTHIMDQYISKEDALKKSEYKYDKSLNSSLEQKARDKARKKGISLCSFKLEDEILLKHLANNFSLEIDEKSLNGTLKGHDVQFLTGGWLEDFIWGLLSKHSKKLKLEDVRLGLHPGKKNDQESQQGEVKNDWDVSFMYQQSLRFVECKTGDQKQDPSGNETLYRVEAVKKQLGALNVKSYLATTSPNIMVDDEIKPNISRRADLYNCTIIPSDQISKLANLELDNNPDVLPYLSELMFPRPEGSS